MPFSSEKNDQHKCKHLIGLVKLRKPDHLTAIIRQMVYYVENEFYSDKGNY